jgi:hypothetical protein
MIIGEIGVSEKEPDVFCGKILNIWAFGNIIGIVPVGEAEREGS